MIYIVCFSSILALQLFVRRRTENDLHRYVFWALVFLLTILGGLRWGVGNDFFRYLEHYNELHERDFREPLYRLTLYFADYLGSFRYFLLFSSLIINFGFLLFIKEYSLRPFLGYLLFFSIGVFYFGSWNLIRQYISISIFLINIVLYKRQRSTLKWVVLTMLATGYHMTGAISFIIPFVQSWQRWYVYVFVIVLSSLLILNLESVIRLTPYWIYLDERWSYSMDNHRNSVLVLLYFITSLMAMLVVNSNTNFPAKPLFTHLILISILLVLLGNYLGLPNTFFYRVNNYFLPALLVIISSIKTTNIGVHIVSRTGIFVVVLIYLIYLIYYKGPSIGLYPYRIV